MESRSRPADSCYVCYCAKSGRVLAVSLNERASLESMKDLVNHGPVHRCEAPVILWTAFSDGAEIKHEVDEFGRASFCITVNKAKGE